MTAQMTINLSARLSWWVNPLLMFLSATAFIYAWALTENQSARLCEWLGDFIIAHGVHIRAN